MNFYSTQYFGDRTSRKVKDKCIELLYKWSVELRHEPKILDAYEMLKRQGIIDDDPILGDEPSAVPESSQDTSAAGKGDDSKQSYPRSIFDEEDKSKLLARLLQSKHPDDLQAANRLIKNMVKQDEEKQEKVSQRYNLLETVRNNVKLLNEMLDCYQMAGGSSGSDKDIIKELHQNIEVERPKLFKLASETEEKDSDGMSQVLQVNDDVVQVGNRYKEVIESALATRSEQSQSSLLGDDLAGLDLGPTAPTATANADLFSSFEGAPPISALLSSAPASSYLNTTTSAQVNGSTSTDLFASLHAPLAATTQQSLTAPASVVTNTPSLANLLPTAGSTTAAKPVNLPVDKYQDLFSISEDNTPSIFSPTSKPAAPTAPAAKTQMSLDDSLLGMDDPVSSGTGLAAPLMPSNNDFSLFDTQAGENLFDTKKSALEDLDFLGKDLLEKTKPAQQVLAPVQPKTVVRPSLNQLKSTTNEKNITPQSTPVAPVVGEVQPLTNVYVSLDTVQPGEFPPTQAHDKNNVKVVLHFAKNKPREDVSVIIVSITSLGTTPLKSIVFQAAVPKSMKVKLQPPSTTELPAYNPILPASAVTQVMLLANPSKQPVKLKYKLSYTMSGTPISDTGDVANFPL